MRTWLSSILLVVTGAFAVASGCGNPDVVSTGGLSTPDASVGGDTGSGASGGSFNIGDGGPNSTGCPSSCDELNANCGYVTDTKCGNAVQCGTCQNKGEVCGGAEPNRCGVSTGTVPDGGDCTPRTCDELGITCGAAVDPKCPGDPLDCGDSCPNNCDHGTCSTTTCVVDPATTCDGLGYTCGQAIDSCGHVLDCGTKTCPNAGDICMSGVCTTPPACVPTTCAALGFTCGEAGDNCGHKLNCGSTTCAIPGQTCSGGSVVGKCGCTGACAQIPTCPTTGVSTTLTGKVYDPAGRNPLYHALVYIANNPTDPALKSFPAGITCDVCGSNAAGSPLISTPGATDPPAGEYSGVDGSFTLKNVPVGNVTLVIQLGRWRRTFPITISNSCAANTLPAATYPGGKLLMPATQAQGNIPLMAMVTGSVDSLECVLRKMGIDKSEFTDPADGGRVQFYAGSGKAGQTIDAQTPTQDALFTVTGGQPAINNYDMTILSCQGAAYTETNADQAALRAYAGSGGRVFATHYSYSWLSNNKPAPSTANVTDNWNEVANWHVDENDRSATDTSASPVIGLIDKVTNPKATAFEGWLNAVGALNTTPADSTTVYVVRHDTDSISTTPGRTQQWLYRNGDNARSCATSGETCTGVGTGTGLCLPKVCSNQHGTVCTGNNNCGGGTCKDNSCNGTDYTGQQTPLHFTFNTPVNLKEDLTATPPVVQCGRVLFSDFHVANASENGETFPQECGKGVSRVKANNAGTCAADADCTGTCTANKCPWGTACTTTADCASSCSGGICLDPMNPQEKLLEYMIFDLGSCVPPTVCTPKTKLTACASGQNCGDAPDGCGGLIHCGDCPSGESCGVGQPPVANVCGKISCTPQACPSTQECGYASDGCDSSVLCGTCPTGKTCNNGKCGSTSCTPETCTDQGIECGRASDQCGNLVNCPTCPAKDTCIAGECVPLTCVPETCDDQMIECGQAADGCGNMIASCGDCGAGQLCVAGKCAHVN